MIFQMNGRCLMAAVVLALLGASTVKAWDLNRLKHLQVCTQNLLTLCHHLAVILVSSVEIHARGQQAVVHTGTIGALCAGICSWYAMYRDLRWMQVLGKRFVQTLQ